MSKINNGARIRTPLFGDNEMIAELDNLMKENDWIKSWKISNNQYYYAIQLSGWTDTPINAQFLSEEGRDLAKSMDRLKTRLLEIKE